MHGSKVDAGVDNQIWPCVLHYASKNEYATHNHYSIVGQKWPENSDIQSVHPSQAHGDHGLALSILCVEYEYDCENQIVTELYHWLNLGMFTSILKSH